MIFQAFQYLSENAYNILLATVANGYQANDQHYLNQVTQCFTNLIAVTEYANTVTKVTYVLKPSNRIIIFMSLHLFIKVSTVTA